MASISEAISLVSILLKFSGSKYMKSVISSNHSITHTFLSDKYCIVLNNTLRINRITSAASYKRFYLKEVEGGIS